MLNKIRSEKEYQTVMKTIETLLVKATKSGGFHKLPKKNQRGVLLTHA